MIGINKFKHIALAVVLLTITSTPNKSEARTNNNWASTSRSQQCSKEAERYANRRTGGTTLRGAAVGGAVGGLIGGNRRGVGRGALVGGGAGLVQSNSQWQTFYGRSYRQCINR